MDPTEAVREFHDYFGLPVHDELRVLEGEELEFRRRLVTEEYEEFMEALDGGDLAHQYKEAADIIYVLYGWDQHAGNKLAEVFAEVHRSNMTKLWPCEMCDSKGWTATCFPEDGSEPWGAMSCFICHGTGKMVKYREDGKVLKPPTYTPPDLSHIIPAGAGHDS